MINIKNLQIGDIIGTTSGSPLSMLIKTRTWGWRSMFSQSKASHIATVVDRGHGLLYFAEMLSGGIHLTEIHTYNHRAPLQHIAFVGRHPAFVSSDIQVKYNNKILALHAKKVKYGWDDFLRTENWLASKIKDNPATMICNELPREGFKDCGIEYPFKWDTASFTPMDWQCWVELPHITETIV